VTCRKCHFNAIYLQGPRAVRAWIGMRQQCRGNSAGGLGSGQIRAVTLDAAGMRRKEFADVEDAHQDCSKSRSR